MSPLSVMVIAGETSGDNLAAELLNALRAAAPHRELRCFGAGGPAMARAGVEVIEELTRHSVIGPADVARNYFAFRRVFHRLLDVAVERRPDLVILVDYSHFNHRFAAEIRCRREAGAAPGWTPRVVKYVSPQVWASRPGRARAMERDFDLLLCIFPFEPEWYASRTPNLRVRYVGHPLLDRHPASDPTPSPTPPPPGNPSSGVLLPGSRVQEIRRHLPVLSGAVDILQKSHPLLRWTLVVPTPELEALTRSLLPAGLPVDLQVGGLDDTLRRASVAIASTGSVTLECAWFRVPTVALYRTSWLTYQIGRRLVTVSHLAMPNLLAGKCVMPEFVQDDATPEAVAKATAGILDSPERQREIRAELDAVIRSLGAPGACGRAAGAILELFQA